MTEAPREQTMCWIREFAAMERPSAAAGERRAAEWIVAQLGDSRARIETETAHGTHLPFLAPSAAALVAGFLRSRLTGALLAALGTAAIIDELEGGRRVVRRMLARGET